MTATPPADELRTGRMPESGRAHIAVALLSGAIAGALVSFFVCSQMVDTPVVAPPAPPVTLDLGALLGAFEGQAQRIGEALEQLPPSAPVAEAPQAPIPVEPAPREGGTGKQPPSDWVTVLDEGLAQVLVERGLTPFDSGVAVHVTAAGERLRRIESDYLEDGLANLALKRDSGLTSGELQDLALMAKQQRRAARAAILVQLASELDALILAGADAVRD